MRLLEFRLLREWWKWRRKPWGIVGKRGDGRSGWQCFHRWDDQPVRLGRPLWNWGRRRLGRRSRFRWHNRLGWSSWLGWRSRLGRRGRFGRRWIGQGRLWQRWLWQRRL